MERHIKILPDHDMAVEQMRLDHTKYGGEMSIGERILRFSNGEYVYKPAKGFNPIFIIGTDFKSISGINYIDDIEYIQECLDIAKIKGAQVL